MQTAMNVEMELASSGSNRDSGAGDLLEVLLEVLASSQIDCGAVCTRQERDRSSVRPDCVNNFGSLCGVLIQTECKAV